MFSNERTMELFRHRSGHHFLLISTVIFCQFINVFGNIFPISFKVNFNNKRTFVILHIFAAPRAKITGEYPTVLCYTGQRVYLD